MIMGWRESENGRRQTPQNSGCVRLFDFNEKL